MVEQPSIIRAIFLSFFGLILFYFTNFIVALILGIIIYFLARIPIISIASKWLSRFLSPDSYLIPICGYFATLFVIGKLSKEKATADLSCVLLGAYLLLISAVCVVLNLIYGNAIWINIIYGITGIVLIVRKSDDAG